MGGEPVTVQAVKHDRVKDMADNKLRWPMDNYVQYGRGWNFGDRVRRKWRLWGRHLGEDVLADSGVEVKAVGEGEVVWAEMKLGSEKIRNWGGVVVLKHDKSQNPDTHKFQIKHKTQNTKSQTFYSIYGHLTGLRVKKGEKVDAGQVLGVIAAGNTPENGWWRKPHLHWGVYTGPWQDKVLPGYWRVERWWKTRLKWWRDPAKFVKEFNSVADEAGISQA